MMCSCVCVGTELHTLVRNSWLRGSGAVSSTKATRGVHPSWQAYPTWNHLSAVSENRLKVECQEDVCMVADISSRHGLMTSLSCHGSSSRFTNNNSGRRTWQEEVGGRNGNVGKSWEEGKYKSLQTKPLKRAWISLSIRAWEGCGCFLLSSSFSHLVKQRIWIHLPFKQSSLE